MFMQHLNRVHTTLSYSTNADPEYFDADPSCKLIPVPVVQILVGINLQRSLFVPILSGEFVGTILGTGKLM